MPGLLGTILGLFQGWDNDPSVQGRAEDWDLIMEKHWLDGHWILGRGEGTFIPQDYTWLDNQWLQTLVGGGIIGIIVLALMHLGAITMAGIAYRRSECATRHLAACLISTQMIGIAVGFTFDSLGFRTYAFFLAILTGAAACLWRLTAPAARPVPEE
jgi:O-antigen ligase